MRSNVVISHTHYRPVSLTCILCRVMKSIVRDNIMDHFVINKLFINRQFGIFKRRRSTLQILDDWTETLETWQNRRYIYRFLKRLVLAPDRQSGRKPCEITSARSAIWPFHSFIHSFIVYWHPRLTFVMKLCYRHMKQFSSWVPLKCTQWHYLIAYLYLLFIDTRNYTSILGSWTTRRKHA